MPMTWHASTVACSRNHVKSVTEPQPFVYYFSQKIYSKQKLHCIRIQSFQFYYMVTENPKIHHGQVSAFLSFIRLSVPWLQDNNGTISTSHWCSRMQQMYRRKEQYDSSFKCWQWIWAMLICPLVSNLTKASMYFIV